MPIISALRKAGHWAERSVMNSRSRSRDAAVTIAKSIGTAARPVGGVTSGSMC